MNRILFWLVAAVAAAVLVAFLMDQTDGRIPTLEENDNGAQAEVTPSATFEPSAAIATPEPIAPAPGEPVPGPDARAARVRRLADGDSFDIIWLDTDEPDEVRLFGINAPERDACFGQSARDVLHVLTEDSDLLVESIERDEFGRVLANVWSDGLFVNATMVELGAALALSDGGRHAGVITSAQEDAKSARAGLWDPSACGADPELAVRIIWIEADAPGRDDQNKNGEWIEIANQGASTADMTAWSIRDESTRHRFFFPDGFQISAGASVKIYSGCGSDSDTELFWCDADPVWNNGGDTGFLVDPNGRFADTRSYGD